MPQSCDRGQTALLHLRRKACRGIFRPKNPTASAGVFFIALDCSASCTLFWYCSDIRRRTACRGFFHNEKSDGFGRERTRNLGFQRPARKPLDHRSRYTHSFTLAFCTAIRSQKSCCFHTQRVAVGSQRIRQHLRLEI
jgi:hypothetical protein